MSPEAKAFYDQADQPLARKLARCFARTLLGPHTEREGSSHVDDSERQQHQDWQHQREFDERLAVGRPCRRSLQPAIRPVHKERCGKGKHAWRSLVFDSQNPRPEREYFGPEFEPHRVKGLFRP